HRVPDVGLQRLPGPQAHERVVDVRAQYDAGAEDGHGLLRVPRGPQLADAIRVALVARVAEGGDAAQRRVLLEWLGIVREGAVDDRGRGNKDLRSAHGCDSLQNV